MRQRRTMTKIATALALLTTAQKAQATDFEQFTWRVILIMGAIPAVLSIPLAMQFLWR